MKYARPELAGQLRELTHAPLRHLLLELEEWSAKQGIPEPTITSLGRNEKDNRAVGGVVNSLHLWRPSALNHGGQPETRAADLSEHDYSSKERERVIDWLRTEMTKRFGHGGFELLRHEVKTGYHLHVGVRRVKPAPPPGALS